MGEFWFDNLILKTYRGSIAYGTNITSELARSNELSLSDIDLIGVCIPPIDYLLGVGRFEQYQSEEPDEIVFSLRKFASLAASCNPNIIECLFVPDNLIVKVEPIGQRLLQNRHLFLSKLVRQTYGGYAYSQLKKVRAPEKAGEKRRELVTKYAYDTKAAMHLIRLLKMGIEALNTETIVVDRPDKQFLMDIRMGKYDRDEIELMAEDLFRQLNDAERSSSLPDKPPWKQISQLVVDLHRRFHADWFTNNLQPSFASEIPEHS